VCEVEVVMGVHMKVGLMECEAAPPSAWGGGGQIKNPGGVGGGQRAGGPAGETGTRGGTGGGGGGRGGGGGGGGQITNRRCVRGCQTARCHVDEDSSLSGNWCCVETLGLCTVSILRIMYRM